MIEVVGAEVPSIRIGLCCEFTHCDVILVLVDDVASGTNLIVSNCISLFQIRSGFLALYESHKTITAIVWNSTASLTNDDLKGLDNPNMLIYVKDAAFAPANRDNVVIGDFAKNIVLTDVSEGNGNFYCPQEFKAETITYSREYNQTTEIGVARGWESIALPFAVQTITHETKGLIAPFGNDASNKHF